MPDKNSGIARSNGQGVMTRERLQPLPLDVDGGDEVDVLFEGANPDEDRTNCPPEWRLEELAKHRGSQEDPVLDHIEHCSFCYQRMRKLRIGEGGGANGGGS